MAEQVVQYTLTLKDLLSGQLKNAENQAGNLESKMGSLAGKFTAVFTSLGVGFAAFKMFGLMHEGIEAYEQLHQAQAQVNAGLESTRFAAGLVAKDLENMASKFAMASKYSRTELTGLQSILLTFPSITKDTFPEATQIIMDMSTRLGQDLKSSAIQVGKALQDPEHGITALRRVGVNFNDTQSEVIKKMAQTGQAAEAQKMILQELNTEFGGSAAAAFNADPLAKYNKMMGSMKMAMGDLGMSILEEIQPALLVLASVVKTVATYIKDGVHWLKENKDLVQALAIGVGVGAVAYGVYTLAINASTIATQLITAAQWAWNAAMNANPIGIIITAIAALTAGVVYAYNKFAMFRGVVWATWAVIKEFVSVVIDAYKNLFKIIHGAFTFNWSEMKEGFTNQVNLVVNAAGRIGAAAKKGYEEGMADFAKSQKEKEEPAMAAVSAKKAPKATALTPTDKTKISPAGATGQKILTINVSINNLIEQFKITTNNLQESTGKVQELVAQTLLSAVRDSEIVAGL